MTREGRMERRGEGAFTSHRVASFSRGSCDFGSVRHRAAGDRASIRRAAPPEVALTRGAFAFNFGKTHILHHYVVEQPFFVRELVFDRVEPVLPKSGVRFNDFGVVRRANRRQLA